MQNLIGFLMRFTEMGYYIQNTKEINQNIT